MPRLRSWIGRNVLRSRPPHRAEGQRFLNLGCGDNRLEGFVNADFFYPLKKWRSGPEWMLDLNYPFDCPSDYWDGILVEHVLEHFEFSHSVRIMKELHRILAPGGTLRVSTPSLEIAAEQYQKATKREPLNEGYRQIIQYKDDRPAADVVEHLVYKWGHHSVWDGERFVAVLTDLGFKGASERTFRESRDSRLAIDLESRRAETVYAEGIK